MPERFTEDEMIALARRAVGRIDALGPRGAEECPTDEIAAMATLLVCLGLHPEARTAAPSARRSARESGLRKALTPVLEGALREALTPPSTPPSTGDGHV